MGEHHYKLTTTWTGNKGTGTSDYRAYERSHTISIDHKTELQGSSDPYFRGDKTRHNPEDLLLASLSACHMLSFLHVCVKAGVIVTEYVDHATGDMVDYPDGSGKFTGVNLNPVVTVTKESDIEQMDELHHKANKLCFIANSVNFPVTHTCTCIVADNA